MSGIQCRDVTVGFIDYPVTIDTIMVDLPWQESSKARIALGIFVLSEARII